MASAYGKVLFNFNNAIVRTFNYFHSYAYLKIYSLEIAFNSRKTKYHTYYPQLAYYTYFVYIPVYRTKANHFVYTTYTKINTS